MKNNHKPHRKAIPPALIINWLAALVAVAILMSIFLELAGDVWLNEGFAWDAPLMLAIHHYSRPWLDVLFMAITQTGGVLLVIPVAGLVAWLWRRQQRLNALVVSISLGGAVVINNALKFLFARPRPAVFPPLTVETSFSFPSGHTMAAVAFYGLLAVLLWRKRHFWWAMLATGWAVLVSFSRIYLGVHYPSDVLAALAVGLLWLGLVEIISNRYHAKRQSVSESSP